MPQAARRDIFHQARQDARTWGAKLGFEQAKLICQVYQNVHRMHLDPRHPDRPNVEKWIRAGAERQLNLSLVALLEPLYFKGGPWEELSEVFSKANCHDAAMRIITNLVSAIHHGIWTKDGVKDYEN